MIYYKSHFVPFVGWDQSFSQPSFAGQQLLSDPVAAMAMQYGQTIAGQGKVIVEEKVTLNFGLCDEILLIYCM